MHLPGDFDGVERGGKVFADGVLGEGFDRGLSETGGAVISLGQTIGQSPKYFARTTTIPGHMNTITIKPK